MKKALVLFMACIMLVGCNGNREHSKPDLAKTLLALHEHKGLEIDGASATYNESTQSMEMSWKGDVLTATYDTKYTDLTGPTPKSSAEGFSVSLVIFTKDAQSISDIDFLIDGINVKVTPSVMEPIGDRGCITAGFIMDNKSFCDCLELLSHVSYVEKGYIVTDKGQIKIPAKDIQALLSMVHSYKLEGGKFEQI